MGSNQPVKKQWIMNAFAMSTPGHVNPGLWRYVAAKRVIRSSTDLAYRHPDNHSQDHTDIEYWTSLAKTLEAGKFHGLFLADMLGIYDVYKGPGNFGPALPGGAQAPHTDPLYAYIFWHIIVSQRADRFQPRGSSHGLGYEESLFRDHCQYNLRASLRPCKKIRNTRSLKQRSCRVEYRNKLPRKRGQKLRAGYTDSPRRALRNCKRIFRRDV